MFLDFVISSKGISVEEEKIKTSMECFVPKNANDVRSFYRRFLENFSSLVAPLNELVRKKECGVQVD